MKKLYPTICGVDEWKLLLNLDSFLAHSHFRPFIAHAVFTALSIYRVNELGFEGVSDG